MKLGMYSRRTIVIMLPPGKTVFNIDWLGVWCEQVGVNFGYVMIPDAPLVPAYTGMIAPETAMVRIHYYDRRYLIN